MKYREVVKRSIVSFMEGTVPEETAKRKDTGLMYTPEYFDQLEEDMIGTEADKKSKKTKEDKDEA
jgi:hypothetical protein